MKNETYIVLICTLIFSCTSLADPVQWSVEDGGNGHYYEFVYESLTWTDAKADSESRYFGGVQGHLATITSSEENEFLSSTFMGTLWNAWLGGYNNDVWITGESWQYDNWVAGVPNNPLGSSVLILGIGYPDSTNQGKWEDASAGEVNPWTLPLGYLVEYDSAEPQPGPVQWSAEDGGNDHWYEIRSSIGTGLSWESANALAESLTFSGLDGHLASITSAAENQFIINNLHLNGALHHAVFIGAFRSDQSSPWQWTDGEDWGFTYWDPGEPKNNPEDNAIAAFSNLAMITASQADWLGGWNDLPPTSVYYDNGYLVEYGAAAPQPNIALLPEGGINFEEVPIGSVETRYLFIWNLRSGPVTITNIYGLGAPFSFPDYPTLPITIAELDFITIEINFEPKEVLSDETSIHVISDPDQQESEIAVYGTSREATPAEQIQDIYDYVKDSIVDGTLVGEGNAKSKSPANNLNNFIKQIEKVQTLIFKEDFGEAIEKLLVLYKQSDGTDNTKDKITGAAASKLSEKIKNLLESIEVETGFLVPEDTWGQYNPDYCSGISAIDQFLCWSPVSGGGSCYAIAVLELRWYKARRDTYGLLPRLRTVYDTSPDWIQDYAMGILQNVTVLQNAIGTLITDIENGVVSASGVAEFLRTQINNGNPVLVIQRGINSSGDSVGHAVVAFSYSEDLDNIYFKIADSNEPNDILILTYNKNSEFWDYYWWWNNFKIGAIPLQIVCN